MKGKPIRRMIRLLWGIVLPALGLCLTARASAVYTDGDLLYVVEEEAACIVAYTGTEEEVYLPSAIAGHPVSEIRKGAFAGKSAVKTVHLPDTVMKIEEGAFSASQRVVYAQDGPSGPTGNGQPADPGVGQTNASGGDQTPETDTSGSEIDLDTATQADTPETSKPGRQVSGLFWKWGAAALAACLTAGGIILFCIRRKKKKAEET